MIARQGLLLDRQPRASGSGGAQPSLERVDAGPTMRLRAKGEGPSSGDKSSLENARPGSQTSAAPSPWTFEGLPRLGVNRSRSKFWMMKSKVEHGCLAPTAVCG